MSTVLSLPVSSLPTREFCTRTRLVQVNGSTIAASRAESFRPSSPPPPHQNRRRMIFSGSSLFPPFFLGQGISSHWALTLSASARIAAHPSSPALIHQQTIETDDVEINDENMKAQFDHWKSKTYALTVPLRVVALNGSLPAVWIKEFLKSQGKRVQFRPEFRQSLGNIFHELSEPFKKGKVNFKSAILADAVTLGDSWLKFSISKGLIEPIKEAEDQDWFRDLSDKLKMRVYMCRSSEGDLDSQDRIWAVPYRRESLVIAYNKKQLQKRQLAPVQVRLFDSQHYLKAFGTGDVWVAVGWSGDVLPAAKLMSNIAVIVPKSGASL